MADRPSRIPDTIAESLEKRGVKSRAVNTRRLNFVGKKANVSFASVVAEKLLTPGTTLGGLYRRSTYEPNSSSGERVYEAVYGDSDYANAVEQDPNLRVQLDEIFGSRPAPQATQIGESSITSVLGLNQAVPNLPGLSERRASLSRAQDGNNVTRDDESTGIRGAEADDAPIEPFA